MGLRDFGRKLFPPAEPVDDYREDYPDDSDYQEEDRGSVYGSESTFASRGANVVVATGGSSIEMKVVTPKSYDTVTQIADLLLSKKTVLLNLEDTNRETARRLIDFLSGVAYALGGDVQKVAENTYAVTPSNVAVSKGEVGSAVTAAPEAEGTSAGY